MRRRALHIALRTGCYIFLLAIIAWGTGKPFIFPSLGPTAYILAFDRKKSHTAGVVAGGHVCGIIAGLFSYWLIAHPHTLFHLTDIFTTTGWLLSLSATVSLALTAFLMVWLKMSHPPACATTLIISLGILPEWTDSLYIFLAVLCMYGVYRLLRQVRPPE